MSISKVNLVKRVVTTEGYRYCKAVVNKKNGTIKPDYVYVTIKDDSGKKRKVEYECRSGEYMLDWNEGGKRRRLKVGHDATKALKCKRDKEVERDAVKSGLTVVSPITQAPPPLPETQAATPRVEGSVADAIKAHLKTISLMREPGTISCYTVTLETHFLNYLKTQRITMLGDITRDVLLGVVPYLSKGKGFMDSTVVVRFTIISGFLSRNGVRVLQKNDYPKCEEDDVETFEPAELAAIFNTCDKHDYLLFAFALGTGLRAQEIANLTWEDINFSHNEVRVKGKPDWRTKKRRGRTVPMFDDLTQLLLAARPTDYSLKAKVFLSRVAMKRSMEAGAAQDFLYRLKRAAKMAGLNCKSCEGCLSRDKRCERFWMHKFRATFATESLEKGNTLPTVMKWMGHKTVLSTMKYLRGATRDEVTRERVNSTFGRFFGNRRDAATPPHAA